MVRPARRSTPSTPSQPVPVAVPNFVTDPLASIQKWPVRIQIQGHLYEIPPLSAADWLSVLMGGQFEIWDIVPGLCTEPGKDLEIQEQLLGGDLDVKELREICLEAVGVASGRPWWVTLRLIQVAATSWEVVGGELAFRRIDATQIPLGAWLDAVLKICLLGIPNERATMFLSQLEMVPPEAVASVQKEEMTMSKSAFLALGK